MANLWKEKRTNPPLKTKRLLLRITRITMKKFCVAPLAALSKLF